MKKLAVPFFVLTAFSACSGEGYKPLDGTRLEIVDPTPDGDFSDAYFRDKVTGETCKERVLGRRGCS